MRGTLSFMSRCDEILMLGILKISRFFYSNFIIRVTKNLLQFQFKCILIFRHDFALNLIVPAFV